MLVLQPSLRPENLNDDLSASRSQKAIRTRRLYAVKAHCNPMLDVARETYKENTHDIMQCESLRDAWLIVGTESLKGQTTIVRSSRLTGRKIQA